MTDPLFEHVHALDACNQRGGRMLSLIDLLDAGTVDLPLAAYLAAAMRHNASLLVGARPGGAGKTAVMVALLNFLPNGTAIRAVGSRGVLDMATQDPAPGATCYLAHEIGDGLYYAYLWGDEARDFFALASCGHTIATNLHADTLEETRDQLCLGNGVAPEHLAAVALKVYLRVDHSDRLAFKRRVSHVYESDGMTDRLLWRWDRRRGAFERQAVESCLVSPQDEDVYRKFLVTLRRRDVRTIEDVRQTLLDI